MYRHCVAAVFVSHLVTTVWNAINFMVKIATVKQKNINLIFFGGHFYEWFQELYRKLELMCKVHSQIINEITLIKDRMKLERS